MPTPLPWFGFKGHGVAATPGYSIFLLPWSGSKANVGWSTRTQGSAHLGGGYASSTIGINNEISWDEWFDAGTYKYAQIHETFSNRGIYSVQLAAVQQGTIDGYSAAGIQNVYSEVTGLAVTAGLKTFRLLMSSKNGSSTDYVGLVQSSAWLRTGA